MKILALLLILMLPIVPIEDTAIIKNVDSAIKNVDSASDSTSKEKVTIYTRNKGTVISTDHHVKKECRYDTLIIYNNIGDSIGCITKKQSITVDRKIEIIEEIKEQ
jgi:hypothetical protein